MDIPEVSSEITSTTLVSDMHFVGLHCLTGYHTSLQIMLLGKKKNSLEVASSTVMRKGKWLFMKGCKFKSPVFAVTQFLNLFQSGTEGEK